MINFSQRLNVAFEVAYGFGNAVGNDIGNSGLLEKIKAFFIIDYAAYDIEPFFLKRFLHSSKFSWRNQGPEKSLTSSDSVQPAQKYAMTFLRSSCKEGIMGNEQKLAYLKFWIPRLRFQGIFDHKVEAYDIDFFP